MKTIIHSFIFFMVVNISFGQDSRHLVSPTPMYLYDIPKNKKGESQLFNNNMMNMFFANKVGTAFGGSNDLSLQKFYASIDANDKSISIGANFDTRRGDELKKLSWVFSGSFKIKSTDKFATIYKNGDFQESNIGATFKISYIGNGKINFKKGEKNDRENTIRENRVFLIRKYDAKAETFNSTELEKLKKEKEILLRYSSNIKSIKKELKKKYNDLYLEMAKEEMEFIESNKLYKFFSDKWISLEVFAPLGENIYMTTPNKTNSVLKSKYFYAFNSTLSANYMREYITGESFFLKSKLNFKNNNNIIVDNLTAMPFQTTAMGSGGTTVITTSEDGYETDFNQFLTTSLTIEPAVFVWKNRIGFSPAVEFNQGKYCKTNWKLGIPISLKDKEGKPKVNFEVQWKEVNTFVSSTHYVGISANFLFGELIN